MDISILIIMICVLFAHDGEGFGVNYYKLRQKLEKQHRSNFQKAGRVKVLPYQADDPFVDQFHTQPLDHFDASVRDTYEQRYWANSDHWSGEDGPVFLYIGGEGSLSSMTVQTGEHFDLAKKYKALIFAVEHRYYGSSLNPDSLKHMKYLSSQQALADLASFHDFVSTKYNLTENNTWICFGGSYPGALSAWFRLKYPHLVYGAIASSAPVKAQVNFEGYNEVVAASLADPIVNGSIKCALNVKSAFKSVDLKICDGKLSELAADFMSCGPLQNTSHELYQFSSNLADVFMGTVQYNDETPGLSITSVCEQMTKPADPYDNLKVLNKMFLKATDQTCADNSWDNAITQMKDTNVTGEPGVGIRQWIYQTCTQFGYYQSCDKNTTCLFSHHMELGPNLDICKLVFNISADEVATRVRFTNDYYGSDQPKGTRIVFVNGSIDPWHALSVLKDLSTSETAIYIPGTAHCANMHSDQSTDLPSLRKARLEIDNQIGLWLIEASKHRNRSQPKVDNTLYFRKL